MKIEAPWLDIYGMVLPQPKHEEKPCDNGVLFTSVAVIRGFDVPNYQELIRSCYLKKGLVARWSGNNFDNCAWDDYLGIAAACIFLKETKIPREILWYGIKHAFFFDADGKLEGKDFLGRHIHVWLLMFVSAFPSFSFLMHPFLWIVKKFFVDPRDLINRNDTSGFQLQWVFLMGCWRADFCFLELISHDLLRREAFKVYYHKDHPFNH